MAEVKHRLVVDERQTLTASGVLSVDSYDENRIELFDSIHSDEEERYNTIGMVDNILFVVYTERKNRVRLISARPANRKERRLYYDHYL